MSQTIVIEIVDKIATCLTKKAVVCGNSNYVVDFVFDEEWEKHKVKTAAFIVNGTSIKTVFEGNVCEFPAVQNTTMVKVGVFAGTIDDDTLSTSTPALVKCKPCVTDGETIPAPPSDDVYNQIVGLCNGAVSTAKSVEERADSGEFKGEDGKDGINGKDGKDGKDGGNITFNGAELYRLKTGSCIDTWVDELKEEENGIETYTYFFDVGYVPAWKIAYEDPYGGEFGGPVRANNESQTPGTSLLRNSKLMHKDVATDPTVEGEIVWIYG